MTHPTRRSQGIAIIWILLIIVAILLIISAILGAFGADDFTKQSVADVEVTGPPTMTPGTPATFTVKVTLSGPIHATDAYRVYVEIYEDDVGDVLLTRRVNLRFPGGATVGTATFALTCEDHGDERWIVGSDGHNTYDAVWEVFGFVPDQPSVYRLEGSRHNVSCPKG